MPDRCVKREATTMLRQTKFDPYDEEVVEPIDLDEGRPEVLSDDADGACAADQEADLLPGHPVPAFLFGDDEEPQPPAEAAPHTMRRRILQATMLAAAAVAIVLAILSREYPQDLFANAEAALPARSAKPAAAPTRDEIAAALRGAYQGVTPARPAETRQTDADPEALLKRFQAWGAEAGPAPR
jgi:hypothetical protein